MDKKFINFRFLILFEEEVILVNKLSHYLSQEVERVWLVQLVCIGRAGDQNNLL